MTAHYHIVPHGKDPGHLPSGWVIAWKSLDLGQWLLIRAEAPGAWHRWYLRKSGGQFLSGNLLQQTVPENLVPILGHDVALGDSVHTALVKLARQHPGMHPDFG